jgi:hypothetical protein
MNKAWTYSSVETVWLRWSDLLVARMWILRKELCSSQTCKLRTKKNNIINPFLL